MKPRFQRAIRRTGCLAVLCLLLGGLAGALRAATLADFGYNTILTKGQTAQGTRPLLVIIISFSNRPAITNSTAFYQSRIFNTSSSIYGFFRDVSKARFLWTMASYQPVTFTQPFERCYHGYHSNLLAHGSPNNTSTAWLADKLVGSNAIWQVMNNGFDFRPFDRNNDGVVEENELSILLISNQNEMGAATRDGGTVNPPSGTLNAVVRMGRVSTVDHLCDIASIAHELCHVLGAIDLYDDGGCKGQTVSIMSCTIPGSPVLEFVSNYLDAWHRMRLGWVEPRICSLPAGGTAVIPAAQMPNTDSPVLLHDPAKGTSEFFILEYRSASVNGSPSIYDQNLHSNGLAIWFIQQDSNHNPVNHPSPGKNWDKAFYPLAAPWLTAGGWDLWPSGATTPNLSWYDSSSIPVRVRVQPFTAGANSITIEWLNEASFWVDFNFNGSPQNGASDTPFRTVAQGLDASGWGGTLTFKTGSTRETANINKRLELRAYNGPVTIGR